MHGRTHDVQFVFTGDYLPPKDIFNKALYIFDIGQNDFTGKLATIGIQGVKQYLPQMALQISAGIEVNYMSCVSSDSISNITP